MIGRRSRILFRREAPDGQIELETPPTARVRVTAPGYRPLTQSVFLDCPPILESTLTTRVDQLLDWSTYERLRRLLTEARLDFRLVRN